MFPYDDDERGHDDDESSELLPEQICYFITNYVVVMLLFICSFVSSIVYAVSGTIYDRGYWFFLVFFLNV